MRFLAQFRTVASLTSLRILLNVLLPALYLLSVCQLSSAGEPLRIEVAAQATAAPSNAETAASRVRVAEGEYKVLAEQRAQFRSMASVRPGRYGDSPMEPFLGFGPRLLTGFLALDSLDNRLIA